MADLNLESLSPTRLTVTCDGLDAILRHFRFCSLLPLRCVKVSHHNCGDVLVVLWLRLHVKTHVHNPKCRINLQISFNNMLIQSTLASALGNHLSEHTVETK